MKSTNLKTSSALEATSKRKTGFPSEARVKRSIGGTRIVNGGKELLEKLGRNDLCGATPPADFKNCCMPTASLTVPTVTISFRN